MSYSRFFMPLMHEASGYEFKGRAPTGRSVVEARAGTGKLSVWVQDLKPETKYGIYIIFAQERRHVGLHVGQLIVDANGKTELRKEISFEHFTLNEFVAVAIIATDAQGVVSPLCGYRTEQISWRHSFSVFSKDAPVISKPAAEEPLRIEKPATIEPPPTIEEEVLSPDAEEVRQLTATEDVPEVVVSISAAKKWKSIKASPPLATIPRKDETSE